MSKFYHELKFFVILPVLLMGCGDSDDDDSNDGDPQGPDNGVTIETITPTGANYSGHDGLSIDNLGNLYVSDLSGGAGTTIFKVTSDGTATIFNAQLFGPTGHFFDAENNLVTANFRSTQINQISPDGEISTFASSSEFQGGSLAQGSDGTIYYSVFSNNRVLKITSDKQVSTLASGSPLDGPFGITVGSDGLVYAANFSDGRINSITPEGGITTLVQVPSSVGYLVFANNKLYATGFASHNLYEIELDGTLSVLAGTGGAGNDDGPSTTATLSSPNGIAVSSDGKTLFVSQTNRRVRKVNLP